MKNYTLTISLLRLLVLSVTLSLLTACGGGHGHGHGGHSANEHMNESSFEELINRFESPERTVWQEPTKLFDFIGDFAGKTIADIGAGTGYFSFPMAARGAKVIAVDIDKRFIDYMEKRKSEYDPIIRERIETRQAEEDNPHLKVNEVDLVLIVNTYHHIENRVAYFQSVQKNIKPEGRLMVVDFFKTNLPVGPPADHKLSVTEVEKELKEAGYNEVKITKDLLKYQYIVEAR